MNVFSSATKTVEKLQYFYISPRPNKKRTTHLSIVVETVLRGDLSCSIRSIRHVDRELIGVDRQWSRSWFRFRLHQQDTDQHFQYYAQRGRVDDHVVDVAWYQRAIPSDTSTYTRSYTRFALQQFTCSLESRQFSNVNDENRTTWIYEARD